MLSLIKGFRYLLNVAEPETEEPDDDLSQVVAEYMDIMSSAKYSDSNTNTAAFDKLLESLQAKRSPKDEPGDGQPAVQGQLEAPPREVTDKPEKFASRVARHLELLDQLSSEDSTVVPAQPCYQPSKFGKRNGAKFHLQYFDIPMLVFKCIDRNNIGPLNLTEPLTSENYVKRFQTLLWMEEAHQQIEMRRYDLINVLLAKYEHDFFLLPVPGLAEGRPSLMRGDKIILRASNRNSSYEGYIYEVREEDVKIKLHEHLHHTQMDGLGFDVSFISSRTPFRRAHHGVYQVRQDSALKRVVFPLPLSEMEIPNEPILNIEEDPSNLKCFMRELNLHQKRAVANMIRNIGRPAPYIVFGPPGTGKTVTLVEAILQIYARRKACKILVCANSNAASDLLARRIKNSGIVSLEHLVRVAAFYRFEQNLIPEDLADISLQMDHIEADQYAKYRIVVSTCIQSGSLNEFTDRFDYVFIDEAGHASEPESMIAIGLLKRDHKIMGGCVLAGDPHQLGPVIVSDSAKSHGLGLSMLERLFKRAVYLPTPKDGKMVYDERYLTKLLISYRCDKRVMTVNNKLFYDNELQFVIKTPQKYLDLLKVQHPLILHPVKGRDRREYTNPSWFNAEEAIKVLIYVNKLYRSGLRPEQLGIITPYRKQIEKLGLLFDRTNLVRCKISTMEEFQGDEREVIIISTVRARAKNLSHDQKFNLGFLFDPKRFNVAVSRAKWLVIVIGDVDILDKDACWIEYSKVAYKVIDTKLAETKKPTQKKPPPKSPVKQQSSTKKSPLINA